MTLEQFNSLKDNATYIQIADEESIPLAGDITPGALSLIFPKNEINKDMILHSGYIEIYNEEEISRDMLLREDGWIIKSGIYSCIFRFVNLEVVKE